MSNNNSILNELYYDPKFGYLAYEKFNAKVKQLYPNIKSSEVKEFLANQEVNQLSKKPVVKKSKMYKINAPELTFQIDLMFLPKALKATTTKSTSLYVFLLCIDVLSRKAYIYSLPNKEQDSIMKAYKEFLLDVNNDAKQLEDTMNYYNRDRPFGIITDDGFNFKQFMKLNEKLDIVIDAKTAYNDHITSGDRLGLIDRLVRTVKSTVYKYVFANDKYSIKSLVKIIIDNYNDTIHKGIKMQTPNDVFNNRELRFDIFDESHKHNEKISTDINLEIGDTVRVLEAKKAFDKEKPQFSKHIYTINERSGNKFKVNDLTREFKSYELQKVDESKVENTNLTNVNESIKAKSKQISNAKLHKRIDIDESNIMDRAKRTIKKPSRLND